MSNAPSPPFFSFSHRLFCVAGADRFCISFLKARVCARREFGLGFSLPSSMKIFARAPTSKLDEEPLPCEISLFPFDRGEGDWEGLFFFPPSTIRGESTIYFSFFFSDAVWQSSMPSPPFSFPSSLLPLGVVSIPFFSGFVR